MLTASTALTNALQKGDALKASVRVIAEWNHNRYTKVTTVDNFGYAEKDNAYDLDLFPIESIIEPIRPTAGIAFAKAGEAVTAGSYDNVPSTKRYYTSDPDSKYKYWTSPVQSGASSPASIANTRPYIVYEKAVWANKIYLCFENSWSGPSAYTVDITTDGTNWTTIYTGTGTNADGSRNIYRQADGSWTTSADYTHPIQIRGVRLNVTRMDRTNSYLNLIEMGARLESDLSDYVVSYDITNEIGDADFLTPMGITSSNTGSLVLNNYDGRFTPDNTDSIYYGLIDSNALFKIDLGIDTTNFGGSGIEYVRQATMYADTWDVSIEEASIDIKDGSKFLQEMKPLSMLFEKVSVGKAIWQILDSIGWNYWAYSQAADNSAGIMDYYWTDPNKTVWEHLSDICRVTQSAAYFDQYGILQIKTRESAFDKTKAPVWTLDYAQNGTKLPDIIELNSSDAYEANKVTVSYKPTTLAVDAQKRPISEIIWEPEDDLVLRSSALKADMNATQMEFTIDKKDAPYWPYEGMVNIRGEIIKYSGKSYWYVDNATGKFKWVKLTSSDQKIKVDNELTRPGEAYRNYFSGTMYITERGVDDSTAQAHDTTIAGWLNGAYYGRATNTQRQWNGGLKHIPEDSILRLQTNKTFTGNDFYCARRMAVTYATPNYYFGTRFKFPSNPAGSARAAGIFFSASSDMRTMYVVDVMTTKALDAAKARKYRNEIAIIRREPGKTTYLGKGAVYAIGDNIWYDLDVQCDGPNITVSVNGNQVLSVADPAKDIPNSSRQGLMVRGFTVADFEYWYAASATGGIAQSEVDNSSYLDLRLGGYYSSQYYRDYLYGERLVKKRIGRKTTTVKQRVAQRMFDEFGMEVHEMREFDIKFEKPVIYSSLYVSNTNQCVVPQYVGSAFGAKFMLANAARVNAVVKGDDTTYGTDNPVAQRVMVTGRTIQQADAKTYEVSDEQAIRARGEIPVTFDSDWIQSEAQAKALGDWIVNNWAKPADELDVTVFGNPLYQLGDVLGVNYSPQNMTASTHKYFVINVVQTWDNGPATTMKLRRLHI